MRNFRTSSLIAGAALVTAAAFAQTAPQPVRTNSGFLTFRIARSNANSPFLSSPAVALPSNLNFYGVALSRVYVNPDGVLTIDAPTSTDFTSYLASGRPTMLISRMARPMIAPYWLFNGDGTVSFGADTVNGQRAFAATWNVNPTTPACYLFNGELVALNRFQVVLIERPDTGAGNFDIEFNYDTIRYDSLYVASGVTSLPVCVSPDQAPTYAAAGWTAGLGSTSSAVDVSGSLLGGVFPDSGTNPLYRRVLNTANLPGRLVYAIRNAVVVPFELTSISPESWPAMTPDLVLVARGTGFDANSRIEWRNPDGSLAALGNQRVATGEIAVNVPTSAYLTPGNVTITVFDSSDPKRRTPSSRILRIVAPVTVTDFAPRSVEKGKGPIELTVRGAGFDSSSTVLFGSSQLPPLLNRTTPTAIVVSIPNDLLQTAGKVPVAVRDRYGYRADAPFPFEITEPAQQRPALTALNPATIQRGSGDFDLTITGSNLAVPGLPQTVTFGATVVPITGSANTAAQVTVRIPAPLVLNAGSIPVKVTVGTLESNTLSFTISEIPKPVISGLSSTSIQQGSGDFDLTILGSNLLQAGVTSQVLFGADPVVLAGSGNSASQLTVRVPGTLLQTARTVPVRVRVRDVESDPVNFAVTAIAISQPSFSGTGINGTIDANSTTTITVTLAQPAPTNLTGSLRISFRPDASVVGASTGTINPNAGFSSGATTTFTIDSGQTAAKIQNPQINTGSVAGTLTVTMDTLTAGTISVLPSPAPAATITVPAVAASIVAGSVKITDNADFRGFTVELFGSSSTREVSSVIVDLRFTASARNDGPATFTLGDDASQLRQRFIDWFNSDAGRAAGGAFRLRIPFSTDADSRLIESVTVTLDGSRGRSPTATGAR